jgi:hypothetical protein
VTTKFIKEIKMADIAEGCRIGIIPVQDAELIREAKTSLEIYRADKSKPPTTSHSYREVKQGKVPTLTPLQNLLNKIGILCDRYFQQYEANVMYRRDILECCRQNISLLNPAGASLYRDWSEVIYDANNQEAVIALLDNKEYIKSLTTDEKKFVNLQKKMKAAAEMVFVQLEAFNERSPQSIRENVDLRKSLQKFDKAWFECADSFDAGLSKPNIGIEEVKALAANAEKAKMVKMEASLRAVVSDPSLQKPYRAAAEEVKVELDEASPPTTDQQILDLMMQITMLMGGGAQRP